MRPGELRRAIEQRTVEERTEERDYLGMSGISRCPAELFERMTGDQGAPSPRQAMLFHEGYLHEEDLVARLFDLGLYGEGRELVAPWDDRFRGHTDGELLDGDRPELLEIKSVSTDRFERVRLTNRCFDSHYDQVQMYMLYGGYDLGMVLYKNRADGRVWPVSVRPDVARQQELERKARSILACLDNGNVRPACECGRHGNEG